MSPSSAIDSWALTPLGEAVLRAEQALAPWILDEVFGFELLQIGRFGVGTQLLAAARTQHSTLLEAEMGQSTMVRGDPTALPFASDALDGVLLPHTLELAGDPYAVLREAVRVLRPEGQLLICAFNPWSGWGLRRLFARHAKGQHFPAGLQRMISAHRLRDWVRVLGCEVSASAGYLGTLPIAGHSANPAPKLPRLPLTAGAYVLKARKRVSTMTMVRPKWRMRPMLRVGAAEPSTRVQG